MAVIQTMPRNDKPAEPKNMGKVLAALAIAILVSVFFKNIVLGIIAFLFLASPKKKKKYRIEPAETTEPAPAAEADMLGEQEERNRQTQAVMALALALVIGIGIYTLIQHAGVLKEMTERIRIEMTEPEPGV